MLRLAGYGGGIVTRLREREKGKERGSWGGGSERGGSETIIFDLKVPRHCPLVLLIRVRLEFRVN
jgi:hypothetical protein